LKNAQNAFYTKNTENVYKTSIKNDYGKCRGMLRNCCDKRLIDQKVKGDGRESSVDLSLRAERIKSESERLID